MDYELARKELWQLGGVQRVNFFLICLPILFTAMFDLTYVFTAGDVNYRCAVAECDGDQPQLRPAWLRQAVPHRMMPGGTLEPQRCLRYAPAPGGGNANATGPRQDCVVGGSIVQCSAFVFDPLESTIVSEFGLTCDQEWKRSVPGTVNNIGQFIGLPLAGFISDKIGRKKSLVFSASLVCLLGLLRSFTWSFNSFIALEFLDAVVNGGIYFSSFILGIEMVNPRRRVLAGTILSVSYSLGESLLGAIAMFVKSWRTLLRVIYAPTILFLTYSWLIPESTRWLVSQGHLDKVRNALCSEARKNGVNMSTKVLDKLEDKPEGAERKDDRSTESMLLKLVRSRRLMLRFLNCCTCELTNAFVYVGLTLTSVAVAGDKNVNFVLVGLVEVPASVVTYYTMDRFSRRLYQATSLMLCAACLFALAATPAGCYSTRLYLFLFCKLVISVSYTTLHVYASEMFPTPIRHSVISTSCMVSRLGTMVAPITPLLMNYMYSLPLILFGSMSLVSGLLAFSFPETLRKDLPDTVEEAENIGSSREHAPTVKIC
ncbi:organic cation transporter protein-like [Bacillus rossius redtenbacheri]|uniref:organic cation transporter protein-like n=1 Tax=Bacillus rossius redtenbacheri TaxID=93214 RepID=UPI002FDD38A3